MGKKQKQTTKKRTLLRGRVLYMEKQAEKWKNSNDLMKENEKKTKTISYSYVYLQQLA